MKTASWKEFPRRSPERNTAKLTRIATNNTIFGGASALRLAKACDRLGVQFAEAGSASEIVSDVYSRSTGRESLNFGAWRCSECESAHIGQERAYACCAYSEE